MMNTTEIFLSLPLAEQRKIIKAARKVSRITSGVFLPSVIFETMTHAIYGRNQAHLEQVAFEKRQHFGR